MARPRKLPDGLRLRGKTYHADFCAGGRRIRKKLSRNLDAAITILNALRSREDRRNFGFGEDITKSEAEVISAALKLPQPRTPKNGWIYFILETGVTFPKVKIGYTASHPENRLTTLQIGSPSLLEYYGSVLGSPRDEKHAHKILSQYRKHGEWFVFADIKRIIDDWIAAGEISSLEGVAMEKV